MATHYIITNREVSTREGKEFKSVNAKEYIRIDGKDEARHNLRYGTVTFNPKKTGNLDDYNVKIFPDASSSLLKGYSENQVVDKSSFGSTKVFEGLYKKGKGTNKRRDILFFIHGFNSDLKDSLNTLGDLHRLYVEPEDSPVTDIVLFTWPAMSKLLKYRSDEDDAVQSGFALARSMASLREFFKAKIKTDPDLCSQNIHLLCHSMGNKVLESMIKCLDDMNISRISLFEEIILAAADIDYNALEEPKPMYELIDYGKRIHIYYHNKDRALGISENTKNAFNRLGKWGAKKSDRLPDDVYESDVTDIEDELEFKSKKFHHWYYTDSPSVVGDIKRVLLGDESVFNF